MSGALDRIAYNVAETWLLQRGFIPSAGWDPDDPLCVRDYGPHRVWTIKARIPVELVDEIDTVDLMNDFRAYLIQHNTLPTAIRFQPYNLEVYACPHGYGTFLYISLYHT